MYTFAAQGTTSIWFYSQKCWLYRSSSLRTSTTKPHYVLLYQVRTTGTAVRAYEYEYNEHEYSGNRTHSKYNTTRLIQSCTSVHVLLCHILVYIPGTWYVLLYTCDSSTYFYFSFSVPFVSRRYNTLRCRPVRQCILHSTDTVTHTRYDASVRKLHEISSQLTSRVFLTCYRVPHTCWYPAWYQVQQNQVLSPQ